MCWESEQGGCAGRLSWKGVQEERARCAGSVYLQGAGGRKGGQEECVHLLSLSVCMILGKKKERTCPTERKRKGEVRARGRVCLGVTVCTTSACVRVACLCFHRRENRTDLRVNAWRGGEGKGGKDL